MRVFLDTYRRAAELWNMPSEDVVRAFANETYNRYKSVGQRAVPVLIAARNEVQDLPATLVALAASAIDVKPIVIDNASCDETTVVAEKMGATVIEEPRMGKMKALKTGLEHVFESDTKPKTVLFTDADTIVNPNWANLMQSTCKKQTTPNVFATGLMGIAGGPNIRTDLVRTITGNAMLYRRLYQKRPPGARGGNMAIHMDEVLLNDLLSLSDTIFPGDDTAIRDKTIASGAKGIFANHPNSFVVTRGDRITSLTDFALNALKIVKRECFYDESLLIGMTPYQTNN